MKYKYFLTIWLFTYFCESLLLSYGISSSYISLLAVISCNGHCLCCVNNTIHLLQSCTTLWWLVGTQSLIDKGGLSSPP